MSVESARYPYGPNTSSVRRFLVRLAGLGVTTRAEIVATHAAAMQHASYQAAELLLGTTIERAGRADAQQAIAGPLLQLVRRTDITLAAVPPNDADALASLDPIAEPALAALLALLVVDLLPRDTFDVLYAPFAKELPKADVVGSPETTT